MPAKVIRSAPDIEPVSGEAGQLADVTLGSLKLYGQEMDVRLEEAVTEGRIEQTIEGAPTITLTVFDPELELLKTNRFVNQKFDIKLDNAWYRLAAVEKQGNLLTFTFEDRVIAWLRGYTKPRKAYRDKVTRAQFLLSLINEVTEGTVMVYVPELATVQPIRKTSATRGLSEGDGKIGAGALKWDFTGGATWYGGPDDREDNNDPYTGIPNTIPGIAFQNRNVFTLRKEWAQIVWCVVRFPNGKALALPVTDKGPGNGGLDVNYSAVKVAGYTIRQFEAVQEQTFRCYKAGKGEAGKRRAQALVAGEKTAARSNPRQARIAQRSSDAARSPGLAGNAPTARSAASASGGFSAAERSKLTVKGAPAKPENFRVASIALGVAAGLKAPYKAQVSLMEALIVESQISNITFGDRDSIGVLQLRAFWSSSVNRMDVAAVVRMFLTKGFWGKGGAIALANSGKYPSGVVAQMVQGSGVPGAYAQFQEEAIAWVRAYGGGGGGGAADGGSSSESADLTVKRAKRYAFKRGASAETENTWQCGLRLAAEVGWRFFVVQNVVFIVAEEDLFDSRPRMVVNRDSDGVDDIDFSIVMGRKDPKKPDPTKNPSIAEMTIPCRIDRWQAPPGTIAEVEGMGPADGKWLVTTRSRDLFSTQGTITLKKPIKELPEPAPEVVESSISTPGAAGSEDGPGAPTGKGGLGMPLKAGWTLTSKFGERRSYELHPGADMAAPSGTPIFAAGAGKVTTAGPFGGYGNFTIIDHGGGVQTCYGHQSSIGVRVGQAVQRGQKIGAVGSTGNSTGPHLHFELRENGRKVCPARRVQGFSRSSCARDQI